MLSIIVAFLVLSLVLTFAAAIVAHASSESGRAPKERGYYRSIRLFRPTRRALNIMRAWALRPDPDAAPVFGPLPERSGSDPFDSSEPMTITRIANRMLTARRVAALARKHGAGGLWLAAERSAMRAAEELASMHGIA